MDITCPSRRAATSDVVHAIRITGRRRGGDNRAIHAELHVGNPTTVALGFLLIVLLAAATSRLWVAGLASDSSPWSFNFSFLPPIGT